MNIVRWCVRIATLGPIGHFSASGTLATLITLPFMYYFHSLFYNPWFYAGMVVVMFLLGICIVSKALRHFKRQDDPSEIVFDEVVGCLLVFWGISLSAQSVVIGFLLFRVLDIIKFGWIKKAEELVGAWGIMSDDIIAALIANLALRLLF